MARPAAPRLLLPLLLLATGVGAGNPRPWPQWQGLWRGRFNLLPDHKLPQAPRLGNGYMGVQMSARKGGILCARRGPDSECAEAAFAPGSAAAVDLLIGSAAMWAVVNCSSPRLPVPHGCGAVRAVGGLSLSVSPAPPPDAEFVAAQRPSLAVLDANWTWGGGGHMHTGITGASPKGRHTLLIRAVLDPELNLLATNISYIAPASASGPRATLNVTVTTWASATLPAAAHITGNAQHAVSRTAVADPSTSPKPITTTLRTAVLTPAPLVSSTSPANASYAFAQTLVPLSPDTAGAMATVSVVTAMVDDSGSGASAQITPRTTAAFGAMAGTSRGVDGVFVRAQAWWHDYWQRSGVSLPSLPLLEQFWYGAALALGSFGSTAWDVPSSGLYGPWVSTDNPSWHGDYTLDYNQEAQFYAAFSSNHPAQTSAYFKPITDWKELARVQAQVEAKAARVTCPPTALHYACHLAPWGFQSMDNTVYMHWNGAFASLLFINHFEYTRNASVAKEVTIPLLSGLLDWWDCYLHKTEGPNGTYTLEDFNPFSPDQSHEGQNTRNPQIALALIKRIASALLFICKGTGVEPPAAAATIEAHLHPFNSAPFVIPWSNSSVVYWNATRCEHDSGFLSKIKLSSPKECAQLCVASPICTIFSFDSTRDTPNCWQFTEAKAVCHKGEPGWTSGERGAGVKGTVWTASSQLDVAHSDMFSLYPTWPSEYLESNADPAVLQTARVSSKHYSNLEHGRPVELFPAAVRAGLGPYGWTPSEIIAGLQGYLANTFGPTMLAYSVGGGVEAAGIAQALNDMLVQSPQGAEIRLLPMWDMGHPVAFSQLRVKGGFLVSAEYDPQVEPRRVTGVVVEATVDPADAAPCRVQLPGNWSRAVSVSCLGHGVPVSWPTATTFAFAPVLGAPCTITDGASAEAR